MPSPSTQPLQQVLEQALQQHRLGRLNEAKLLYEQVLAINPGHPDALHLLGLTALQAGNPARAVELIRRAAELQPRNWGFQGNLAAAYFELRKLDEALSAFRAAAALNPDEPQLQMGIANCLALQGALPEAERQLRALTERHADFPLAWLNLANAVRDQGRREEAIDLYRRALALDPNLADAHNNLGSLLHALEQFDDAERAYRAVIAIAPEELLAHCNLASVLIDSGKFAEAEAACREALRHSENHAPVHSLLAAALGQQGRLLDAIASYRNAVALDPHDAGTLSALGSALFETGETAEGLSLLERAGALMPESWHVRRILAGAYLALGEFEKGWREYQHRPARALFMKKNPGVTLDTALPAALSGKHVCVVREQGLGDELFFLRYAAELKARGARITYRANAKIASILARVPLIDTVLTDSEPLPAADFVLTVGDLPFALAPALAADRLPPPLPLAPLPSQRDAIARRLAELGPPPYFGLTWRAGTPPREQGQNWGLYKQIPLEALANALRGVEGTLLALQRHPEPGEIERLAALAGRPVHDFTALNEDLEAMLALLALIDDYVGASNTNMHLHAGVAGCARVLVPCPAEWRWMARGEASPWFPGFRIYRQGLDGDWSAALARLAADLRVAVKQ